MGSRSTSAVLSARLVEEGVIDFCQLNIGSVEMWRKRGDTCRSHGFLMISNDRSNDSLWKSLSYHECAVLAVFVVVVVVVVVAAVVVVFVSVVVVVGVGC